MSTLDPGWRQAVVLVLVGALAGGLAIGLRELSVFSGLEHRTLEARFAVRGDLEPSADVVVVGLDVDSLSRIERPPVARARYARVVHNLRRAGASVIAFDFTLEQPSDDDAGDLALARALTRADAAVVGVQAIRRGGETEPLAGRVPFDRTRVRPASLYAPFDSDGAYRRYPVGYNGVPSFAVVAAALHSPATDIKEPPPGALIDFRGPAESIEAVSFIDVLNGTFDASAVRRRIAVVGPTAPILKDIHATGVGGSPMAGAEIQAHAIATALDGYPLRRMSSGAIATLLFVLSAAVVAPLCLRGARAQIGSVSVAAVGAVVLVAWTVAAQLAFNTGAVVDYSAGVFAVLTAALGAGGLVAVKGRRARAELRALFAAYSPNVVARVLAQNEADPAGLTRSEIITGYRIEEEIGGGGMGVVYRATELRLGRVVALKLIRPQYALRPVFRARFERETRTAALVGHPNIVPVFDAGEDAGLLYIAMMLVDGVDLAQTVRLSGPLKPDALVTMLRQIASALDAAHDHGLVHRDVKPGNILMTSDPAHAYLTDFGIAKQHGADDESLTITGRWVGTVDYLAPEIAAGEDASARSDVYALTAVLFYGLTGAVPFDRPTDAAKLRAHAEDDPPSASAAVPGMAQQIDGVIARGMAKNPSDRYGTALDLAEAAALALGQGGGHGPPRDHPPCSTQ